MKINAYDNRINFGTKFKTESILEIVSGEPLSQIGRYKSAKNFVTAFYKDFTGHVGYWQRAQAYVPYILEKYPSIAKANEQIMAIKEENPRISRSDLHSRVKPIIKALGQEIDIE